MVILPHTPPRQTVQQLRESFSKAWLFHVHEGTFGGESPWQNAQTVRQKAILFNDNVSSLMERFLFPLRVRRCHCWILLQNLQFAFSVLGLMFCFVVSRTCSSNVEGLYKDSLKIWKYLCPFFWGGRGSFIMFVAWEKRTLLIPEGWICVFLFSYFWSRGGYL
jgi:hypothetical protein